MMEENSALANDFYGTYDGIDDSCESQQLASEEKIDELQLYLEQCPDDYKSRIELITLLRNEGELESLREQREIVSKKFTMPPDFWLDWIRDEISCGDYDVAQLFELAVKDFHSPDVYVEFVQYACGISIDFARKKMEEAVNIVGMRPDCAFLIWNIWIDFEKTILSSLNGEEAQKQKELIENLYERSLMLPYKSIDEMFKEYLEFVGGVPSEVVKRNYEKALEKMPETMQMESELESANSTHEKLEIFSRWIRVKSAKTGYDPSEMQSIYERALTETAENPNTDLWLQYGWWLDYKLKVRSVAVKVYERGIRHAPCAVLWQQYLVALERSNVDLDIIEAKWPDALKSLCYAEEGVALYRTYIYILRRYAKAQGSDYAKVVTAFEHGCSVLDEKFGACWDENALYRKNYAHFLFTVVKDVDRARKVWSNILSSGNGRLAQMWLEAVKYERFFGEVSFARRLLYKGINSASDHPHQVFEALLQFEREEGTLEELDKAVEKIDAQVARIAARPQKTRPDEGKKISSRKRSLAEEKCDETLSSQKKRIRGQKNQDEEEKHLQNNGDEKSAREMKSFAQPLVVDEDGFAVPALPSVSNKKEMRQGPQKSEPEAVESNHLSTGEDNKSALTIFISNLDFKLSEERIKEIFPDAKEVRLVYRGMSKIHKGFGYVDFESSKQVEKALKKDRTLIDDRPLYVSEYKPSEKNRSKQFQFSTGIERNKIFVRNVHYDASEEQLREIFSKYGTILDIRIVVHKSGKPKGCAYIEFETAENATAAAEDDDVYLLERKLSIAISNPPKRETELKNDSSSKQHQRNRLDFVPRSLKKPIEAKHGEESAIPSGKPMTNDQFRSLFNK